MTPESQTRACEMGDTAKLFCEMIAAASEGLDLNRQDAVAISRATAWMAEDLAAVISDLTAQGANPDHIDPLRSVLGALRSAEERVRRKVFNLSDGG